MGIGPAPCGGVDELVDRGGSDEPLAAKADAFEFHALAAFQAPAPKRRNMWLLARDPAEVGGRIGQRHWPVMGQVLECSRAGPISERGAREMLGVRHDSPSFLTRGQPARIHSSISSRRHFTLPPNRTGWGTSPLST